MWPERHNHNDMCNHVLSPLGVFSIEKRTSHPSTIYTLEYRSTSGHVRKDPKECEMNGGRGDIPYSVL